MPEGIRPRIGVRLVRRRMESVRKGGSFHRRTHGSAGGLNEPTKVTAGNPPVTSETTDRVECILLTTNGQCLMTDSIYEPPQVWDRKIWHFDRSRCRKMRNNELYTASFLRSDEEHVILNRREAAAHAPLLSL